MATKASAFTFSTYKNGDPQDDDDRPNAMGKSPLGLACTYGQLEEVEKQLKAGANPLDKSVNGRTALHDVVVGGYKDCLKLLLDYTAEVNIRDRDGMTPGHVAAFNGELGCIKILQDRGGSLVSEDRKGRQIAHYASMRNHKKILQYLFDQRVDLDCRCHLDKTPVHYAAQHGALDSVILLVQRDCDITIADNNGYLPAHHAAKHNKVDCLRFLVKQGTPLEATQSDGKSLAHVAAQFGALDVVHWLFDKGANPNQQDLTREKPCDTCYKKHKKVEWDRSHPLAPVERQLTTAKSVAYKNPVPNQEREPTQLQINLKKREKRLEKLLPKKTGPERDVGAKYFGEFLDPLDVFAYKSTEDAIRF
ncbi:Hypothetical predicted protein [Mytilus galloprovincialis]|uniref:Uncharacterized protein n=1 Tax=Mytilus galloprovincialis TaxID=29158 RepID=A0A8B6GT60_MYTGA|nr:Hypothetical predicted protein [Mytilus galloprovincialis]